MKKIFFFVLIFLFPACSAFAQIEIKTDSGAVPEFASSITCAKCHLDIHNYWKDSLHAHAVDDYIFQAAFMLALKERGDAVRELCLHCHAPTTALTKDTMMHLPLTSEAITCDFCHRISQVDLSDAGSTVTLTTGDAKHGPLEFEKMGDAHPSVKTEIFTEAKLCAACHQWSNENGIPIFDTYREWLAGPLAEKGVQCQECHMPLVEGSLVAGAPEQPDQKINSHNLAGGHSITQVASAAKVDVASVDRVPGGLHVVVKVSNIGSGHMIPTGVPSRALVLDVELTDSSGNVVEREQHEFRKTILDEQHIELTTVADMILRGALISKDNRIPPGETVSVPFDFAASPGKKYLVRATLRYTYRPLVLKEEEISIEMGSDTGIP